MNAEDQSAAPDVSGQPEPQVDSEQQTQTSSDATSYGETLLKLAAEEGHTVGTETLPPETETPETEVPETEPAPEEEKPTEEESSGEDAQEEQEAETWPASASRRVAVETARKRRALERAEKAEETVQQANARIQELERQVGSLIGPRPTEESPFNNVNNIAELDQLAKSYEDAIDLADENPDGAVDVLIGRNPDGSEKRVDFTQDELLTMRRKAEKAIRKQIPERRTYLQQRAVAHAEAFEMYPELKDPKSEFSQQTAFLVYRLLSGEALKDPTLLTWVAHAVRGFRDSARRNGTTTAVRNEESRRILKSAAQQIAPTPTRTRSFPERRGADLAKAEKELAEKGTSDAAEKYVAALFSKREAGTRKVERFAE